ncbi:PAS domain S-box protein [Solirubrobacter sp. CPCC 204708]|uniref:histidine kinase n=1 Tax=Solirubrobacter deserti TaxID=2282478 RepID=A0ABT4RPJ4_9ACTN|nr:PAS domain S-box protein [Solirubrobacter deserti]MBE2319220.1 PAS domain S-box protein [Solirubrobacter deserti]MDA0140226.1 PAS domain S-box protein [Solirubrobacter deserti]
MRPAELLRAVTAALASPDEETAFARLPGKLQRSLNGHKKVTWDGSTMSIPVAGVGVLLVPTPPPDDDLMAAAESVGVQISQFVERCRTERARRDIEARRRAMLDVAFDSVFTMDDAGIVLSANRAAERTFGYTSAEIVGQELASLIIPETLRDAHREGLARYLKTGRGPIVGRRVELTAMRRDGTEFPVELVVTRPEVPGERVFYGYLRDLTARNVAEAALHRLADEQAALRRVATAVAAFSDPTRLFDLLSEEVGKLLEAQTAHMFRFDSDGRAGEIVGGWAVRPEHVLGHGTRMPMDGDTAVTRVWRTGQAARMDSYAQAEGRLAEAMRSYGVQAVVAAPVFLGGSLWGAVIVSSMSAGPFPEGAEQRIAYFAELAAQALANAQAREDLASSRARIVQAGDAERRRLERNLHDGAQQRLVSLALMLRLAARRHPEDDALTQASEELAHALQELRELARGIHPAVLTERGLEPAVRAVADRAPVPVELSVELEERLDGPVEAAAYYVVSEALANIAKYAQAKLVQVTISRSDVAGLRIEVVDDGVGGADPSGGSGLRGLADRVEALSGQLSIDSPPGLGTTLRADIPV